MSLVESIIKFWSKPNIDNINRYLSYGRVINSTSLYDLRKNNFTGYQRPVFFLSTGRCGTSWFTSLLSKNKDLKVFHVPQPELAAQSKLAYEICKNIEGQYSPHEKLLPEIFLAGREELFLNCIKSGLRFIETDPRPTFFAPIIAKVWPDAIFVHLYRHPGEVVCSGVRRNWYKSQEAHELSRIHPLKTDSHFSKWNNYSHLEKVAWLWNETNLFIEDFKTTIEKDRYIDFNFNELSIESVDKLLEFLQIEINASHIRKLLNVKVNKQKPSTFPEYTSWNSDQKNQLINICGDLMNNYNYK
ncbi:MAG: sulfotransferase [Fulvivirga sp.]